ncbi:NAD(P)-dependent oxidoreductase [Neisseria animalis]|uniref:NAD(P)-dependent oxidoreductase n=1 Tax=Neisseria animalis TaxID=492 RepID=A0A5P3MUN6_NEIAN|nr:NAD(P)-dependent oxidoreductase [Neisseria animalis]QEY24471.1 NAD(P)-dependent oxidoreductase [Neisseria animalis]ROW33109.1 NAD(P)-dependent oxidoreductase [Neisseria animalis]VEE07140.1 3-hydroxyacid dehydrogenase [Neisseria animalis]
MQNQTTSIGWIGIGQMGVPMVSRLLDNGITVGIYNRSPDKTQTLEAKGATSYPSIAALLQHHDVIFLMVSDYAAVLDILDGDTQKLLPGKTIINMSTIAPSENLAVKQLVEAAGGRFAEAPVSGSVAPATNGTLLILFGGEADILEPLQQVFSYLGKKTFHFGGVGKGSGAKLVLNSLLGIFGEAYSEAMLMARRFEIDTDAIIEAVGGSAMDSPMFQTKKSLWAEERFPAAFMLKHASKDLNLACAEMAAAGCTLPALETVAQSYREAVAGGFGEDDVSGVYQKLNK